MPCKLVNHLHEKDALVDTAYKSGLKPNHSRSCFCCWYFLYWSWIAAIQRPVLMFYHPQSFCEANIYIRWIYMDRTHTGKACCTHNHNFFFLINIFYFVFPKLHRENKHFWRCTNWPSKECNGPVFRMISLTGDRLLSTGKLT